MGIGVAVAVVGVVLAAVSTAGGVGLWQAPQWEPSPPTLPPVSPSDDSLVGAGPEERSDDVSALPRWVEQVVAAVLIGLGVVGAVVFVVRAWQARPQLRIRRPKRSDVAVEVLPDIAEAVTEDAERQRALLLDGSPRNAIVRTWLRLEHTVAAAGLDRDPSDTAAEFTERVLTRHAVEPDTIRTLASLYREARFSEHPIDEHMRAVAIAALDDIHHSLRGQPIVTGARNDAAEGAR